MKSMAALLSNESKRGLLIGGVVILIAGALMYSPSFDAGFWTDDYAFVARAARATFPQGLVDAFDPFADIAWYRPLQIVQWLVEYRFFGSDAVGYHLANTAIHLVNCVLLLGLVSHLTRKWWVGLVTALAFLSLSPIAIDVFWPGVADPLMTLFYLVAMIFWLRDLENASRWNYLFAFVAFVAALLTKEMSASLIVILFLMDRCLVHAPTTLKQLGLRYLPLIAAVIPYALIEYSVSTRGVYVSQVAYRVSGQMFVNIAQYLQWLAFPWEANAWIVSSLVGIAVVLILILTRDRALLFVTAAALIALLPVLPFPFALQRYLYLPTIASAVLAGLGFESLRTRFSWARWREVAVTAGLVLAFVWSSLALSEGAFNYSEFARVTRLQFRPIYQRHPTFPPDTLLYFIQPPFPSATISEMMYVRYGANVSASGTDRDRVAELRARNAAFVYYFDENVLHEQPVEKNIRARVMPDLPIHFGNGITLQALEIAGDSLKPGDALVLLFYWSAVKKVDQDFTVFVHLVDMNGQMILGADEPPRQGSAPTSSWEPNRLLPDGHIVAVDASVAPGSYQIEAGLYNPQTMERLLIVDAQGRPYTDKIIIEPINVGK